MRLDDLHFGQCVIWRNAAGRDIPARVVDIVPSHDDVAIVVKHRGGKQQLRVRPQALRPLPDWEVAHVG